MSKKMTRVHHAIICIIICILLANFASCTHLTSDGSQVRLVTDRNQLIGCEYLGQTIGGTGWGGYAYTAGVAQAETKLRNGVAEKGGDTLYIVSSFYGPTARMVGDAYKCK